MTDTVALAVAILAGAVAGLAWTVYDLRREIRHVRAETHLMLVPLYWWLTGGPDGGKSLDEELARRRKEAQR